MIESKIWAECDSRTSHKCRVRWLVSARLLRRTKARNNDKNICVYCSRAIKSTGRNNPNCKYKSLDDCFFDNVDTEEKAYFLGWIASDGSISKNGSINIFVQKKDAGILR